MMAGGSLWPVIATLAAQGAPGGDVTPPPPAPGEPPVAGDVASAQQPAEELIPPPPPVDWQEMIKDDLVTDIIEGRRRPGYRPDLPDARLPAVALTALIDGLWLELSLGSAPFTPEEASGLAEIWLDRLLG